MFEEFSRRNRAVIAAMSLAATRDWGEISLADIAQGNLSLADLRREFVCKNDLCVPFRRRSMRRFWRASNPEERKTPSAIRSSRP